MFGLAGSSNSLENDVLRCQWNDLSLVIHVFLQCFEFQVPFKN